jgi:general secretion pathway protein G
MYNKVAITLCLALGCTLVTGCSDQDAKRAQLAKEHVHKLNKAADFFYLEKKKCPQSANDLAKLFTGKEENQFDFSKDPWGNNFVMYSVDNQCHFKSLGADGKEGGDGFDADIVESE